MNTKILFIGGGTGGHIMPLIPLVKVTDAVWEKHLLTDKTENDRLMVEENFKDLGIMAHQIKSGKIRAYVSLKNLIDIPIIIISVFKSYALLKKIDPDILFFKGGYVGFPMVLALKFERFWGIKRRKIFLHESDITPGKLYKMLSPIADGIFKNFGNHPLFYYESNRFPTLDKEGVGTRFKQKLLIFGGSQGAQWINQSITKILPELLQNYQVTLITGQGKAVKAQGDGFSQYELLAQTALYKKMAESDLIITRGGASIFQVLYLQKKALIIPLSGSARNHQVENAQYFAKQGLCHTLDETKAEPSDIIQALALLSSDQKLSHTLKQAPIKPAEEKIWKILETSLEDR